MVQVSQCPRLQQMAFRSAASAPPKVPAPNTDSKVSFQASFGCSRRSGAQTHVSEGVGSVVGRGGRLG